MLFMNLRITLSYTTYLPSYIYSITGCLPLLYDCDMLKWGSGRCMHVLCAIGRNLHRARSYDIPVESSERNLYYEWMIGYDTNAKAYIQRAREHEIYYSVTSSGLKPHLRSRVR